MEVDNNHKGTEDCHTTEDNLRCKEDFLGDVVPRNEAARIIS